MATNTFTERIKILLQGAKKAASDGRRVESTLKKIQKAALAAGGTFFAAQGLIEGMKHIIKLSLETEKVGASFTALGSNFGIARSELFKLREAVNGTVSDLDLMTAANQALSLGVVDNIDDLAALFDTAQRLGKGLGQDTLGAIDSLSTGIGRNSIQLLDNLGIIVRAETANKRYAEKMGIVGRELDETERKLAFNEEAMRQATEAVSLLGEESLSASENLAALSTQVEGFWTTQTTFLMNTFGQALEGVGVKAEQGEVGMTSWVEAMNNLTNVTDIDTFANEFKGALGMLEEPLRDAGLNLEELEDIFGKILEIEDVEERAGKIKAAVDGIAKRIKGLGDLDQATFLAVYLSKLEELMELENVRTAGLEQYNNALMETTTFEERRESAHQRFVVLLEEEMLLQAQLTEEEKKYYKEKFAAEDALEKAERRRIDASIALGITQDNVAQAAGKASAVYIGDKIKEILAEYIFTAFKGKGFLGGLGAVATGAAFSSTLTQMLTKGKVAAEGMSEIVTEPTLILAGEAGAEYVDIDPLTNEGAGRGSGVNITFTGNVMSQDFIESEAIPMIKKAIRKGGDIGIG